MVQLGICAFRQGMIKDAHNALLDIQSSGRAKELLGQGLLMRNMQERNAEQEKIEKRRQVTGIFSGLECWNTEAEAVDLYCD